MNLENISIGIIGLGYVGLPLAAKFGEHQKVLGFDINAQRISELNNGIDATLELSHAELSSATGLQFTDKAHDLANCNFYIITVPTPITASNEPDLSPLISATKTVGKYLS